MVIYAETPRLILRSLEKSDLPQLVELIGAWDVARWLAVVPHPYTMQHAEEFYQRMSHAEEQGLPEYFLLQKKNGEQIGAIGLHPPREPSSQIGELVIGYWLGKNYWGEGLMSEAISRIIDIAFQRPGVTMLTATTNLENNASQKVLRKAGLACIGTSPDQDPKTLRGSPDVTRWQLTRDDYQRQARSA